MIYSDVVNKKLILPKKTKYTIRDVENVIINSLFSEQETFSVKEARFIVLCSALYHDTDFSKSLINYPKLYKIIMRRNKTHGTD